MHEIASRQDRGPAIARARFNNRVAAWQPMTAVGGTLPRPEQHSAYAYETTTTGQRVLAHVTATGQAHLISETGDDVTAAYPELSQLPQLTHDGEAVFDAEVVRPDRLGRPSPQLLWDLLGTHHHEPGDPIADAGRRPSLQLVICDVLYAGQPVLRLPYIQRRMLLRRLILPIKDHRIITSHSWPETVAHKLAAIDLRPHGYTGIVAKNLTSTYQPGCRSRNWLTTTPQ
ncbi:hypothetical protein ACIRU3_45925 [Streptomyces sp. NPDC101151]|uniref:ATP-dependent DNA ligase n=1 Tax=Streptomyces sp. NPDC101151 TaxID=3366115 RepID=UPI00380693AC